MWLDGLTAEDFGAGLQSGKGYGIWEEGQEVLLCRESLLASAALRSSTAQCSQEGSQSGGAAKGKTKEEEKQ